MLVQVSAPGVPLDLIDEWLRGRYKAVLLATDWTGLHGHGILQTTAAYESTTAESVTLTVGSASVTGVGTNWTDPGVTGRQFYRVGDNVVYSVAGLLAPTSLQLDRPYEANGTSAPGAQTTGNAYAFMTDIYALPDDARTPVTIINPVNQKPLQEMTKGEMDIARGSRSTVSDPWTFAIVDDSDENSPPVRHRVQFYPPPKYSRGFTVSYLRNANEFNGENTGASPLPFVTDAILLAGARAEAWLHLENFAKAAGYERAFAVELDRILLDEHARNRKTTTMHMASRFSRHRLSRVDRMYGRNWGKGQGSPN